MEVDPMAFLNPQSEFRIRAAPIRWSEEASTGRGASEERAEKRTQDVSTPEEGFYLDIEKTAWSPFRGLREPGTEGPELGACGNRERHRDRKGDPGADPAQELGRDVPGLDSEF